MRIWQREFTGELPSIMDEDWNIPLHDIWNQCSRVGMWKDIDPIDVTHTIGEPNSQLDPRVLNDKIDVWVRGYARIDHEQKMRLCTWCATPRIADRNHYCAGCHLSWRKAGHNSRVATLLLIGNLNSYK